MIVNKLMNNPYQYQSVPETISDTPVPKQTRQPRTTYRVLNKKEPQTPAWQSALLWTLTVVTTAFAFAALGMSIFDTKRASEQHNKEIINNITTNETITIMHNTTTNTTIDIYVNGTFNGTYVKAIIPGNSAVTVDDIDPYFPILYFTGNGTGIVQTIVPGTGILVDDTDPVSPIVSTTAILNITSSDPQIIIDYSIPQQPSISANLTFDQCLESIIPGLGISIDNSDPLNPIVNNTGVIEIIPGDNIQIDNSNPQFPIISTNLTSTIIQQVLQDNGSIGDPFLLSYQGSTLGLYQNQGAAPHSRLVILIQSGTVGQTVNAQTQGLITGMTGLTSGQFYYYDSGTNLLTITPTSYAVGYAFSTTSLFFNPQPIYIP
jgi:hypothetical protein